MLLGVLVFGVMFYPVLVLELSTAARVEILGIGLFFGSSVAIVAGATAHVLSGAARDLAQLRTVLNLSDEDHDVLVKSLSRQTTTTNLALIVLALVAGTAHNFLLNQHLSPMPFRLTETFATLLMWIVMLLTLPKIISNAMLFSRLGRRAQPDLLRPSRHAAFGTAALRPAVFQIGIVCMYGFLLLGDSKPFDDGVWIGIAACLGTLAGIVFFPLLGIRQRIRETRRESLQALDLRIETLDISEFDTASVKSLDEMDTLLDMRERVARAPGWPLDLAGVRRILLYIILPPLTWAAAAVMEMLINAAL